MFFYPIPIKNSDHILRLTKCVNGHISALVYITNLPQNKSLSCSSILNLFFSIHLHDLITYRHNQLEKVHITWHGFYNNEFSV